MTALSCLLPIYAHSNLAPQRMELTMLTALVLICSVVTTPNLQDCTSDNATTVLRVPAEFANPTTCFMHGQAYLG